MRNDTEVFGGAGFSPRRTMPLTMWLTSASGCSGVSRISSSFIEPSRAQSVLDVLEEDFRFAPGRFAEGDDVDFMFGLGLYDGNRNSSKQAKGDQALFTVGESVVLEGVRWPFEDLSHVDEVEPVLFQVRPPFRLAPGEPHGNNVHTICRCGKSKVRPQGVGGRDRQHGHRRIAAVPFTSTASPADTGSCSRTVRAASGASSFPSQSEVLWPWASPAVSVSGFFDRLSQIKHERG
jgi:hypothetical protein